MREYLKVGQILKPHGVKGEVKVYPLTDNSKRYSKLKKVYTTKDDVNYIPIEIESVKYVKEFPILKLKGIDTVNDAEKLRQIYIYVDRENAVKLPKDSYFIADLIGMKVITDEGEHLGEVVSVFPTGSNDVYEVKSPNHKKNILLPAIKDVILEIDIEAREMKVHILEGLI
ncbi:ribosome maturation factor RimM [Clostridium cylindrosporum]|uniref:Ribosome maturation factor RimM n=1 Tax=Clostridium cylindrosporum DSM 605 TaxID=1121307 RepID=A0A0J8D6K9_CLOCY|nr:ribosome maturation factor RimM [Clostridium cylindrosporum]KMT21487.1 ribosome maturation factor RimM [Clostridium cylindrosporum DSM 605]